MIGKFVVWQLCFDKKNKENSLMKLINQNIVTSNGKSNDATVTTNGNVRTQLKRNEKL